MNTNPEKVNWNIGAYAAEHCKDLGSAYSEAVRITFRSTGRFAPGFDAKDLVAWIRINYPDTFDKKGKRK